MLARPETLVGFVLGSQIFSVQGDDPFKVQIEPPKIGRYGSKTIRPTIQIDDVHRQGHGTPSRSPARQAPGRCTRHGKVS